MLIRVDPLQPWIEMAPRLHLRIFGLHGSRDGTLLSSPAFLWHQREKDRPNLELIPHRRRLDDAVQQLHQPRLHIVLVVIAVAASADPQPRAPRGVRRHVHVARRATPLTGDVAQDEGEGRALEVEALVGAHAHHLAHSVPQLLHLQS